MAAPVRKEDFKPITVAEFDRMPESYGRFELIDGRIEAKPVAGLHHNRICSRIYDAYKVFDPNMEKAVLERETRVYLTETYSPVPDISIWLASDDYDEMVSTAPRPDIAIEVQSPDQSLKELSDKALEYLDGGVPLVWIIQPGLRIAAVYRLGKRTPETIQPDGVLDASPVLPGFKVVLASLFPPDKPKPKRVMRYQ